MSKLFAGAAFLSLGLLMAHAPQAMAQTMHAFAFPDMAFRNASDATATANRFIRDELPAGISVSLAEQKLRAAHMACAEQPGRRSVTCTYYTLAGGDGGTLSEMWWTMHLDTGPDGHLTQAQFNQSRDGFAP